CRSPFSSSMQWAPRAWHRSSTSGSDGDARTAQTPTAPAYRRGRPSPALGRLGDRRPARGPCDLALLERARTPQVRNDAARALETGRLAEVHRPARERQRRTPPRPATSGLEGSARSLGRRHDRHRRGGAAAAANGPPADTDANAGDAREVHAKTQARRLD